MNTLYRAVSLALAMLTSVPVSGQTITTVAGTGVRGFCGDNGPATSACLTFPWNVTVDASGNLFIVDNRNNRIRKVDATGTITTVAGSGAPFFCGDNGPATSACLWEPSDVAIGADGSLFIADNRNNRIRKVDVSGIITTFAGGGAGSTFCGDNGPATSACLNGAEYVALDDGGNLFISGGSRVRKVDAAGIIRTVAGNGRQGCGGIGGPAVDACLLGGAIAFDLSGNLLITQDFFIAKVDATGILSVVGGGTYDFCGDGGPVTEACFRLLAEIAVDALGNLFVADVGNQRIRKIDTSGTVTTIAGNGTATFCGDNGPAAGACLFLPLGVDVDATGSVYISDTFNHRIRKVPSLTLTKTSAPMGVRTAGELITYTYVLKNTGAATLMGPFSVDDDKATVNCPATLSLLPGMSTTCTSTYVVTQQDLYAGSITNSAFASNSGVTSTVGTVTIPVCAADVSSTVRVARGPFRFNRVTQAFSQTITMTNTGAGLDKVQIVLDGLASGVTLTNKTGTSTCDAVPSPLVAIGHIAAGASVTLVLQFKNPANGQISYGTRVQSLPSAP